MDKNIAKGIKLIKQVENEKAITFLSKALKDDPNNPEIHRHLGIAFTNLGDHTRAVSHLRKAVNLDPAHHQTWWNLGNIYEIENQYNEASQAYQEAANIAAKKNPEKAKRYLEWVQRVKPK
ncbi:MAG: tetratricopeptide repeat protein [Candidatus Hodarchaeota archaeon]